MGRAPCCSKVGLHRGAWSDEEDKLLTDYIQTHGEGQWRSMPSKAGLLRCEKSCRLRWVNYFWPGIKRGSFTTAENETIIRLHSIHGSRWSLIATQLSGRTDNEIKNYWNSHLKWKLLNGNCENRRKKKRKTDQKSKKIKVAEEEEMIIPQVPALSSSLFPTSQLELSTSASSSNSIVDQGEVDWSPLFDIEGASSMDGQDEFDLSLEGLDLMMMEHGDNEMLEKLYDELLVLIQDGDGL